MSKKKNDAKNSDKNAKDIIVQAVNSISNEHQDQNDKHNSKKQSLGPNTKR
jgi:hypothetical protein